MIQKDYIMRMIEQLTKVLAKVIFNKKEENYKVASIAVDDAFNTILGLNYDTVKLINSGYHFFV